MIIRGPVCIKPHKCNLKSEGPSGPSLFSIYRPAMDRRSLCTVSDTLS